MDSLYLVGSEDVKNAGYAMKEAATEMKNASSWILEALQQHQQFLDDWLMRFETILKERGSESDGKQ